MFLMVIAIAAVAFFGYWLVERYVSTSRSDEKHKVIGEGDKDELEKVAAHNKRKSGIRDNPSLRERLRNRNKPKADN